MMPFDRITGVPLIPVEHMVEPDTSRTVPRPDLHEAAERNARRWRGRWPCGVDLTGRRRPMEPLDRLEIHPMKPMDNVFSTPQAMYAHPETIKRIEDALREASREAARQFDAYIWREHLRNWPPR